VKRREKKAKKGKKKSANHDYIENKLRIIVFSSRYSKKYIYLKNCLLKCKIESYIFPGKIMRKRKQEKYPWF